MLRIAGCLSLLINMRLFFIYFIFTSLLVSQEISLNNKSNQWVDSIYNSLSLEEKIGQLFVNWVSPEQSDFKQIEKLNFTNISYKNLSGGIVAIHSAWKI